MLKEIFDKYNCDKSKHHYHTVYEPDFEPLKDKPIKILEIGIWKGTSHSSWHEYFPNAQIYGVDIFSRINPEDVKILSKDRVHWLKYDSTSLAATSYCQTKWGSIKFDIIIDDGRHDPESNARTFENFSPMLAKEGIYYIEDVWPLDVMTPDEYNHRWIKSNPDRYNTIQWKIFQKSMQGFKVQWFDLREPSNLPDSYIFRITR